jgi:hypothetical protein
LKHITLHPAADAVIDDLAAGRITANEARTKLADLESPEPKRPPSRKRASSRPMRLTAKRVERLKAPGRYPDGNGLY